jgi:hypothetical protein
MAGETMMSTPLTPRQIQILEDMAASYRRCAWYQRGFSDPAVRVDKENNLDKAEAISAALAALVKRSGNNA